MLGLCGISCLDIITVVDFLRPGIKLPLVEGVVDVVFVVGGVFIGCLFGGASLLGIEDLGNTGVLVLNLFDFIAIGFTLIKEFEVPGESSDPVFLGAIIGDVSDVLFPLLFPLLLLVLGLPALLTPIKDAFFDKILLFGEFEVVEVEVAVEIEVELICFFNCSFDKVSLSSFCSIGAICIILSLPLPSKRDLFTVFLLIDA